MARPRPVLATLTLALFAACCLAAARGDDAAPAASAVGAGAGAEGSGGDNDGDGDNDDDDGDAKDAPRLFELTPRNFAGVVDGRRVVLAAFVNPQLRRSARMHPVLHELRAHFAASPSNASVLVAYADVNAHRGFVKRFALKSLPTLLAFPRGPNLSHAPVLIGYEDNKTTAHYRRELEALVAHCDGLASAPAPLAERVRGLVEGVVLRDAAFERQERARNAAEEAAEEAAAAVAAAAADAGL